MFKQNSETKGYGSIRKKKVYGAVGILALGAMAIVGNSQASADEVVEAPAAEPVATSQASADSLVSQAAAVEAPAVVAETPAPVVAEAPVETPAVEAKAEEVTASAVEAEAVANTDAQDDSAEVVTNAETKVTVQNEELNKVIADAEANDIRVDKKTENLGKASSTAEAEKFEKDAQAKLAAQAQDAKRQVDKYKKDVADAKHSYLNGTSVEKTLRATTQNVDNLEFGDSFMNAEINPNNGNFTITHDTVDGVQVIGKGTIKGRINYDVKSTGDAGEVAVVSSVDLFSYSWTKIAPNSAIDQNISLKIKDTAGNLIYSYGYDGNSSFNVPINKKVEIGKSNTIKPGETTPLIQLLEIHDDWIHDTHGQLWSKFKNTNTLKDVTSTKPRIEVTAYEYLAATYGDVTVEYKTEDGKTIKDPVKDETRAETGKDYDTTDNKPQRIEKDGSVYELIPDKTQGQEKGKVIEGNTTITYIYRNVKGDVTVHYEDENSNVIKEPVRDEVGTPVGKDYDTTDNKPNRITDKDGRTYEIVPGKTKGTEKGKVKEGNTDVTYVYKEVKGNVIVHYEDEYGNVVKDQVDDTRQASTNTPYDTTDHKPNAIKANGKIYNIVPSKTKGAEKGVVKEGDTHVTYVYKEVKAEPTKVGKNDKGADVNGKTMLAGSTEIYDINIDNDQYKGISSLSYDDKEVGLILFEKYDHRYVTPNLEAVRVETTDGKAQKGFTTKVYNTIEEAPKKVQAAAKAQELTFSGPFAVTTSDDPQAYTRDYIMTGTNLKLVFPTTVTKDIKEGGDYENTAIQVDFSGSHETNVVKNNIPKIQPKKDVFYTIEDGENGRNSLDGKTVKVGDTYNFLVKSAYFPASRGQSIVTEELQDNISKLARYDGVFKARATVDYLLKDGTTIAKGTDLNQYIDQVTDYTSDENFTKISLQFKKAFLESLSDDSEFEYEVYFQVTQVKPGIVENTATEITNGIVTMTNTVKVIAEEPGQPTPETPVKPTPETPVAEQGVALPETGENNSVAAAVVGAGALMTALSMLGFAKRKED